MKTNFRMSCLLADKMKEGTMSIKFLGKRIWILWGLVLAFSSLDAQEKLRPVSGQLVNDFAAVLNEQARQNLEQVLTDFARESSTQITLVTTTDLQGYAVGDYAVRLAHDWGVGQSEKDNGILILVKPRRGNERGEAFIAVGYGLEEVVPDVLAGRIVDHEIIPHFREEDYYSGFLAGIAVLMELTRGEYTADAYMGRSAGRETGAALFVLFFFGVVFVSIFSKARRLKQSSIGHDLPFWVLLSMMGSGSRRHSGHWGNFSSGSGSFGGFGGGGGFGGFGGGGFGGGGAGGSW